MKIAFFSDNFYPEISGISDSVILLGKELAGMGHEVHFFGPRYTKANYAIANIEYGEPDFGEHVHFHRVWSLPYPGSPTGQSRNVIPTGICTLKFRSEKFDVIHVQSPFGVGMEGLLMAKMLNIPIVGTNHTPIEEFVQYVPIIGPYITTPSEKFYCWYYNRCQFITAPYQGLLDEMKKTGLKKDCEALSNPIDLKNFSAVAPDQKKALKEKYELSNATILYTGRLADEKHIDVIIRALKQIKPQIPDAMLAITGHGNATESLQKLSKSLGLEVDVKFFGRVDDQAHAELYQASDVFAIMSTAETQSLSLMKAMATGIPVIGANARALPHYITPDCGFVVPVGNDKILAEKLHYLLRNPEVCEKMGQQGIVHVAKFSARKIAERWIEIYAAAIQEKQN